MNRSTYEAARRFILLCQEAGIMRDTRNYLWQGLREEGLSLQVKRKESVIMRMTDVLYRLARASATGRAARKGPVSLGRRYMRRTVYRAEGRETRRILRKFGL